VIDGFFLEPDARCDGINCTMTAEMVVMLQGLAKVYVGRYA